MKVTVYKKKACFPLHPIYSSVKKKKKQVLGKPSAFSVSPVE